MLAAPAADGSLQFTALSGKAPLVEVAGPSTLRLCFPSGECPPPGRVGGLAINFGLARRARINGELSLREGHLELTADETFTLCRKYLAPSLSTGSATVVGPSSREALALDDAYLADLLARADTAFLASASPDGAPDVAHRGGPPGFIELDSGTGSLSWPEFVGDGVFKSAGNVRATGRFTLLVLDVDSGDGVELVGSGAYTNKRTQRSARLEPLVQFRDHYPLQGMMTATIERATLVRQVTHPRRRIEKALKVTSSSLVDDQAPQ
jgi:hypothetical protein